MAWREGSMAWHEGSRPAGGLRVQSRVRGNAERHQCRLAQAVESRTGYDWLTVPLQ